MNCPWNARRTVDTLQRVDGVAETTLPRSDAVVVRYDPTRTSEAAITAAAENPKSTVGRESEQTNSRPRSGGCRCGCRNRPR